MTRAMCSRTSKRKQAKQSEEVVSENCKENSPRIKNQTKKQTKICSNVTSSKKNIVLGNNFQNSVSSPKNEGHLRKSERHRKSPFHTKDYLYSIPKSETKTDILAKRNVLSDKTNSPITRGTKVNTQSESLQTILNKYNNCTTKINTCQSNEICEDKGNSKHHIPVYKTIDPSGISNTTCNPLEKNEAVYEFDEVDENEEPVKKKTKKKRAYVRKPRMGPKSLTINNIKYSSTESLVSLPEKLIRPKKSKKKMVAPYVKPYTSVNNINDSDDTCNSVQSFMSQPASLLAHEKRELLKNRHELSVLQETQSENCQSPYNERSTGNFNVVENQPEISVNCHSNSNVVKNSAVLPSDSHVLQEISAVSQQRCYPSKKSLSDLNSHGISYCGSVNNTLANQVSHCSANISTGSSHDFLSSTPCKRTSSVVCHNSVFDDSEERDIPIRLRPSTGFIKGVPENMAIDDNCFGFDEPEELEEPLVSPIKNINLPEPRKFPYRPRLEFSHCNDIENPKLDLKEVIEQLKSSIPKAQAKDTSHVFNSDSSSSDQSNSSSPISKEMETTLSFIKPPRRSYERQRRIRHYSEPQEEDEDEEEEEEIDKGNDDSQQKEKKHGKKERENVPKPAKNCYQKKNVSKVFKAPHVPIAKQRLLKEEEESERLAAQMNAQFQEIDKCDLMVE